MKYKINITFDDSNSLDDIFIKVLIKEINKILKNEKKGVSLPYTDVSLNEGGSNYTIREH